MLSSKYRFHSRGGVKYTYQKGKTIRTPKVSLVFAPNKRMRQRYAVVVSKKFLRPQLDAIKSEDVFTKLSASSLILI